MFRPFLDIWLAVFWVSLTIILYTYALYPVAIGLLARFSPRPWRRGPWLVESPESPVTIVMAVHNGARMLPAKIDQLLSLDATLVNKMIVVSDGSTDATPEILLRSARAASRLHAILLDQQVGKAAALNHGIAAASSEILLFVDIRPQIDSDGVAALLSNFADPSVGCVAGELVLGTRGHDAAASAVSGVYWRYEQAIRRWEAEFDSPVGVYGGFYAIRRSLATPFPPGIILDDMFQPLSIIRQGYRSVLDRTAIVTDIWPASAAGEFQRKIRTLAGNFQLIALAPWVMTPKNRLLFQLVSHKLLRLIVPYCFALLLASSAMLGASSIPFALFGLLQTMVWFVAALSLRVPLLARVPVIGRITSAAGALLVLNAAAVAGLYTFLFTPGPLWKIWAPTQVRGETA